MHFVLNRFGHSGSVSGSFGGALEQNSHASLSLVLVFSFDTP